VSGSTSDASASEPAAPSSGSLRSFLREYWSSATRPSLAVLLVVLATTLGIFGAATIGLTQETMAHGAHAFLANVDSDHAAFATGRALKLGLSSSRDLRVVVVGASSTREAMDADDLERTVLEHAGVRVRVDNLATGSQFLVESMALSERIPDGARGVLLIGVGSVRFSAPPESLAVYAEAPRLGIRSDQLDALYREAGIDAPPRTGSTPTTTSLTSRHASSSSCSGWRFDDRRDRFRTAISASRRRNPTDGSGGRLASGSSDTTPIESTIATCSGTSSVTSGRVPG
jgi:hypothetical protein